MNKSCRFWALLLSLVLCLSPSARSQSSTTGVHNISPVWGAGGFGESVTSYDKIFSQSYDAYTNTNVIYATYDTGVNHAETTDDCHALSPTDSYGGYHGASSRTTASYTNIVTFSTTNAVTVTLVLNSAPMTDGQLGIPGDQESSAGASLSVTLLTDTDASTGTNYSLTRSKGVYVYDRNNSYGSYDSFYNSQKTAETLNGTLNRLVVTVPPRYKLSYTVTANSFVQDRTFNQGDTHRFASSSATAVLLTTPLPLPAGDDPVGPDDRTPKTCPTEMGMATYNFHSMLASLLIKDTPVGYTPPYGVPMPFTVSYTQRATSQPAALPYANLGPKWNTNWTAYITDDPADPTAAAGLSTAGGGRSGVVCLGSDGTNLTYRVLGKPALTMKRPAANTLPYEIANADGTREIYGQPDGSTVAPRKVYLTQRIDAAGNVTTLTYDSSLRLTKLTDTLGQVTTLTYGLAADPLKITKVTDPFGRSATFGYDGQGRLVSITDVLGLQSQFTYEGTGDFLNSMTTPYGRTTFTSVDSGSVHRIMATDPAGDTEVVESNQGSTAGLAASDATALVPQGMTVLNEQLDVRNSFYWDKKQWKEGAGDYTKAHVYHWLLNPDLTSMSRWLESEKAPLEGRVWYNYPDQSNAHTVGQVTVPSAVGRMIEGGTRLERTTINPQGQVAALTDPVSRTTNFFYSADGVDLLKSTQSVSSSSQTLGAATYNAQHRPLTVTDISGRVTTYKWNTTGQITSVTNAKSEATSFNYYTADAPGKQRRGRLASIDGPLAGSGDSVSFDYDAAGNAASVTGPDGYALQMSYDALDRLTRTTYPDATYAETVYQALDPLTRRDRQGRLTRYTFNSLRQLVAMTDPANRTTQYGWCKCGHLAQIIDAMGRSTVWALDLQGRPTRKIYTDGSGVGYAYEPLSGRLSTTTDEKGQVKTAGYNLDDTVATLTYTNAERSTPNVAFTYDASYRRVTKMVDGIGTTTYNYVSPGNGNYGSYGQGGGQLSTVVVPLPNNKTSTLSYNYDELGRRVGSAVDSASETRTFDALSRVVSVTNAVGTFGYTYVGATNRPDVLTYPNGMTCAYNYYPAGGDFRLKDMIYTLSGNSQLARYGYEYSPVGDITRWTQVSTPAGLNRSWLCGYDAADQLTSVTSQDPATSGNLPSGNYKYSYDPAGNRLTSALDGSTVSTGYNALNQLTALNTTETPSPALQTYEWDAENRLTVINYPNTNQRSEFTYDGVGRRVRVVEKTGANTLSDLRYIWNGLQLSEERDAAGATVQKRYFNRGMQTLVGGALANRMLARDHLGSARALVSDGNGVTSTYDFDAWGKRSMPMGQADESGMAFTGHWFHAASGHALAPFRAYNTATGRWLSRDPIGEQGGNDLYGYAGNNPVALTDPVGTDWVDGWQDGWSDGTINWVAKYGGIFNNYVDPNVTLGYADSILFNLPSTALDAAGMGGAFNKCDPNYRNGNLAGTAVGLAMAVGEVRTAYRAIKASTMLRGLKVGVNGLYYGGRRGAWSFKQVAEWHAEVQEAAHATMEKAAEEGVEVALDGECECPKQ